MCRRQRNRNYDLDTNQEADEKFTDVKFRKKERGETRQQKMKSNKRNPKLVKQEHLLHKKKHRNNEPAQPSAPKK